MGDVSITIYANQAPTASGFDFRLFFTGLTAHQPPRVGIDPDGKTAYQFFMIGSTDYLMEFHGSQFEVTPSGIRGVVSSAEIYLGNEGNLLADMTIFSPSNIPIASSDGITPDTLMRSDDGPNHNFGEIGGAGADKLWGSDYTDYLYGGAGHDTLTGNGGNDQFSFDQSAASSSDRVTDFQHGHDKLLLDRSDDPTQFKGVSNSNLINTFHDITTATEQADDRILYNHATGQLFYDPDGAGGKKAVLFATLTNHAAITFHDLKVF